MSCRLDEQATEFVLKTLCSFLRVSGVLELATPRDAFITTLCKACLPPHYAFAITVENVQASPRYRTSTTAVSTNVINAAAAAQISAKNLQCMRSLLGVVHCHGGVLGSAWYLVLNTLQHLTDILNLKAASSGSFKAPGVPESSMAKVSGYIGNCCNLLCDVLDIAALSKQFPVVARNKGKLIIESGIYLWVS